MNVSLLEFGLVAFALALALVLVGMILDCISALRRISEFRENSATRSGRTRASAASFTTIGRSFGHALQALHYRLENLRWEVSLATRWNDPIRRVASNIGTSEQSGVDKILRSFLSDLRGEFRHIMASCACADGRMWSLGVGGWRFEDCFKRVFSRALHGPLEPELGFLDYVAKPRAQGDFALFGIRFEIAGAFKLEGQRAVFWLGYPADKAPTETEKLRFSSRIYDLEAELEGFVERRQLLTRAQAAESKSTSNHRLIAEISHDIRSPLSNIKGILNVLRVEGVSIDTPSLLDVAVSNCDSMNEIVEALIDFSRVQTATLVARKELTELGSILRTAVESFAPSAQLKGVSLAFEAKTSELEIEIDPRHLRRILNNLLSNAVKYTDRGSIGIILDRSSSGQALISVRDSGRGMTTAQLSKLFTPFERFHTDVADGLGLGLVLTKSLVTLNGGQISVASDLRHGSNFELTFPLSEFSGQSIQAPSQESPPILKDRRILVVDDDHDCVDTLARSLQLFGCRTDRAYGVEQALQRLEESEFFAVVSDAHMPRGGVEKVLSHCLLMKVSPPVVVLSGSNASRDRLLRAGIFAVLSKPADMSELKLVLERAFSRSHVARAA